MSTPLSGTLGLLTVSCWLLSAYAEPSPLVTPTQSPVLHQAPTFEGDVLVFAATMVLVFVTVLLVFATFKHVKHSKELVAIWANILELDRIARLAISVLDGDRQEPYIHLQNIGRVPIMISELVIELAPSQNGTLAKDAPLEARSRWILPLETLDIRIPHLSRIWGAATYNKVRIDCTFYHAYDSRSKGGEQLISSWKFDHNKKVILRDDAGGS
jgi:hypothetical protein